MRLDTTLVQPISAAINVSVGDRPQLVPPRSTGSSITLKTSRATTRLRAWVWPLADIFISTCILGFIVTIGVSLSMQQYYL